MGFHRQPTGRFNIPERVLDGAEVEGTLQELVAQLPSSARFDAANRYLEVRYGMRGPYLIVVGCTVVALAWL